MPTPLGKIKYLRFKCTEDSEKHKKGDIVEISESEIVPMVFALEEKGFTRTADILYIMFSAMTRDQY